MRSIRLVALAVVALFVVSCNRGMPQRPDIPVTKQPGRAMNEEMIEYPPGERPIRVAATKPKETAVAQTPAAGADKPVKVADAAPDKAGAATRPAVALVPAAKSYGVENNRFVNQSDEVVSVLKNGAVVIAKRMPSPVVAVRGYVYTGGVYEGQWLGGGLSHLLEHLVAGGSSRKRTEAQNRDLLQRIGNNSNAYTTDDHTAYYVNTTTEHLDEA